MATHEIEVGLPAHRVLNADLTVVVKSDGKRLGELRISKGTLDWHPARRRQPIAIEWEAFARLLERWQRGELGT